MSSIVGTAMAYVDKRGVNLGILGRGETGDETKSPRRVHYVEHVPTVGLCLGAHGGQSHNPQP